MRIVIAQDYLRSGGTERQAVLLADSLAEAGHRVLLLTFRPGGALAGTVRKARHKSLQPLDMHLDWFAPGLLGTLRRENPDAVFCLGRMANAHGWRIKRHLPSTVLVATYRTGKPLPWLFRRTLRAADGIVANSEEGKQTLVERYQVPKERVTVIANALVFPKQTEREQRWAYRRELGAEPGTLVLLCVAMFRREKNQLELIEVASRLPTGLDWQLWLAGDGPSLPECQRRAGELRVNQRVRFMGWTKDPRPLYGAADIAVLASTSEALSNFLIEAQAHGLPAVAYRAQGNAECFIPDRTGYVIPRGDQEGFRDALLQLASLSAEELRRLAVDASAHARRRFEPAKQIGHYEALVRRLQHRT